MNADNTNMAMGSSNLEITSNEAMASNSLIPNDRAMRITTDLKTEESKQNSEPYKRTLQQWFDEREKSLADMGVKELWDMIFDYVERTDQNDIIPALFIKLPKTLGIFQLGYRITELKPRVRNKVIEAVVDMLSNPELDYRVRSDYYEIEGLLYKIVENDPSYACRITAIRGLGKLLNNGYDRQQSERLKGIIRGRIMDDPHAMVRVAAIQVYGEYLINDEAVSEYIMNKEPSPNVRKIAITIFRDNLGIAYEKRYSVSEYLRNKFIKMALNDKDISVKRMALEVFGDWRDYYSILEDNSHELYSSTLRITLDRLYKIALGNDQYHVEDIVKNLKDRIGIGALIFKVSQDARKGNAGAMIILASLDEPGPVDFLLKELEESKRDQQRTHDIINALGYVQNAAVKDRVVKVLAAYMNGPFFEEAIQALGAIHTPEALLLIYKKSQHDPKSYTSRFAIVFLISLMRSRDFTDNEAVNITKLMESAKSATEMHDWIGLLSMSGRNGSRDWIGPHYIGPIVMKFLIGKRPSTFSKADLIADLESIFGQDVSGRLERYLEDLLVRDLLKEDEISYSNRSIEFMIGNLHFGGSYPMWRQSSERSTPYQFDAFLNAWGFKKLADRWFELTDVKHSASVLNALVFMDSEIESHPQGLEGVAAQLGLMSGKISRLDEKLREIKKSWGDDKFRERWNNLVNLAETLQNPDGVFNALPYLDINMEAHPQGLLGVISELDSIAVEAVGDASDFWKILIILKGVLNAENYKDVGNGVVTLTNEWKAAGGTAEDLVSVSNLLKHILDSRNYKEIFEILPKILKNMNGNAEDLKIILRVLQGALNRDNYQEVFNKLLTLDVLSFLKGILDQPNYASQDNVGSLMLHLSQIYQGQFIDPVDQKIAERVLDLNHAGFPILSIFIDSPLTVGQLSKESRLVLNGGMENDNPLHVALNYANYRQSFGSQEKRLMSLQEFKKTIERIRNGDTVLEESLTDIPNEDKVQVRGLVYEAYKIWKQIQILQQTAHRPLAVVENLSYGAVALSPITVERAGRKYIVGTNIPVISTKIGSTESHHNEFVLRQDLFTDEQAKEFMLKKPIILVVDGSTSVGDSNRTSPHIPDGFKGYRNYFMALTKALTGRIDPDSFNEDSNFVQDLEGHGEFSGLVHKLSSLASGLGINGQDGYQFTFWYPGEKTLYLRNNKRIDIPAPKLDSFQDIQGSTVVFVQSGIEKEYYDNPTNPEAHQVKEEFIQGDHSPVYFDDQDHYKRFQVKYEEGFGIVPSRAYIDYSREEFFNLLRFLHEKLPEKVAHEIGPSIVGDRQVDTLVLDLDGTLAELGGPLSEDMINRLVNLLNRGKKIIIATDDKLDNVLDRLSRLIQVLPNGVRDNLYIFANGATRGVTFSSVDGRVVDLKGYNKNSVIISMQYNVIYGPPQGFVYVGLGSPPFDPVAPEGE